MKDEDYKNKIVHLIDDLNNVLKPSRMGFDKVVGNLDLVIEEEDYEILLEVYFTDEVFNRRRIFYISKNHNDGIKISESDKTRFMKLSYYSILTFLINNSFKEVIQNDSNEKV